MTISENMHMKLPNNNKNKRKTLKNYKLNKKSVMDILAKQINLLKTFNQIFNVNN